MKLFFFNCEEYGECASVVAETLEQAIEALKKDQKSGISDPDYYRKIAEEMATGKGYRVEIYNPGQVLWTEWS